MNDSEEMMSVAIRTPEPEMEAHAYRRRFSTAYKLRILAEADACTGPGALGDAGGDDTRVDKAGLNNRAAERKIFRLMGEILADQQVSRVETVPDHAPGIFIGDRYEARLPSLGQARRAEGHSIGVHPEGGMQGRAFAEGAVDKIGEPLVRVARGMMSAS